MSEEPDSPATESAHPAKSWRSALGSRALVIWKPIAAFIDKDPLTLAASIAFYSALSFAPIMVLGLWLASQLSSGSEQRLVTQIGNLLGPQVRQIAVIVTQNADQTLFQRSAAGIISLVTLGISATTAFAQLQAAINRIWDVSVEPASALWSWIRRRLLSFGIIAAIGFLLIVALVFSALLTIVLSRQGPLWTIANELVTVLVFSVAFAGLFRYVPDARAPWAYALPGGIFTSILFESGKWALGTYLGSTTTADAYGAASSMILLLVWVYYSSIIVLIGAEVTRQLADHFGAGVGELAHSRNGRWLPVRLTRSSDED
jgi:membrane protein